MTRTALRLPGWLGHPTENLINGWELGVGTWNKDYWGLSEHIYQVSVRSAQLCFFDPWEWWGVSGEEGAVPGVQQPSIIFPVFCCRCLVLKQAFAVSNACAAWAKDGNRNNKTKHKHCEPGLIWLGDPACLHCGRAQTRNWRDAFRKCSHGPPACGFGFLFWRRTALHRKKKIN